MWSDSQKHYDKGKDLDTKKYVLFKFKNKQNRTYIVI